MKTYLKHKIHNVIDIKGLTAIEYLDFEGKYKNYEEKHNFWELCYVDKGNVDLSLDGELVNIKSGEVIFIPPDKKHSYICDESDKSNVFVICFETFSNAMKTMGGILCPLDEDLKSAVEKIISEYKLTFYMNDKDQLEVLENPNFGGQQVIILQLEYIIICLLRKLSTEKNPEVVFLNKDDFYSKLSSIIIDYFHSNINSKLSLENICKKVNYSKSFLCKTFKEQTGESLFSYFNKLKIDEAKRLLSETNLAVTVISKELGFSDVKYFGSLFKKIEGISPTEFKRTVAEKRRKQDGDR